MLHEPTGFSASLVALPATSTPASRHLEPEHCTSAPTDLERVAWVEHSPETPIRVFFAREETLRPVGELEAYASYLFCPGGTPWVKIYAIGDGVARCASHWCMDGRFGPEVEDLAQVGEASVSLKIYACKLLPGTELGQGLLYTKDVAFMDRDHPVVVFTWQYASRKHLLQLGVLPDAGPSLHDAHALYSPLSAPLDLLRASLQLATDIMTPEQRAQLGDALSRSKDVLALLPPAAQVELERYRDQASMTPRVTPYNDEVPLVVEGPKTRSRSAPERRKSYADPSDSE
ncbi:uncharacterized protein RHOBADRAFT_50954 [Rhodotorula graminis WP1]|uniref:Uncharacterized protein n=1 Tax=Rhodotorula graminis (strain WP1) TaxID=578459 RepID=A0A194SDH3_RHOGW|nr:uncharacterized protein RHOBADRAFT_50954 [Rhodotorula graminis WP1]KPV78495.1 hypothetical protein RHOBADRAFT_50954 [Rhodotorula graminis WP1]